MTENLKVLLRDRAQQGVELAVQYIWDIEMMCTSELFDHSSAKGLESY